MTVTINEMHIYIIVSIILLFLTLKPYERESGYINFNGLKNVLFGLIFIVYTIVWGGIFWW